MREYGFRLERAHKPRAADSNATAATNPHTARVGCTRSADPLPPPSSMRAYEVSCVIRPRKKAFLRGFPKLSKTAKGQLVSLAERLPQAWV